MSDDAKKALGMLSDALGTSIAAGAAAGAALVPVDSKLAPLAWAGAAVAGTMFGKIVEAWQARKQRRTARLLDSAGIALGGMNADTLADFLEANAEHEWSERTVFETMRAMIDALDDAVVPALGRLLAEYVAGQRTPDRFFRGAARMLADLSAEEFHDLGVMLRTLVSSPAERPFKIHIKPDGTVIVWLGHGGQESLDIEVGSTSALRLFNLIEVHHLGVDANLWGKPSLKIDEDTAQWLAFLVG